MSLFRVPKAVPLFLALALLTGLTGCGFQPVYGTGSAAMAPVTEMTRVAIDPIPERSGQLLRNHLIDRLYSDGRPANPSWRLAINLETAEEELGFRKDAIATRARLRLTARYELIDTTTKQPVYRSFSRAIVSYNILDAQYGTLVTRQDAVERGLTELSEDIRTRLALYFSRETP